MPSSLPRSSAIPGESLQGKIIKGVAGFYDVALEDGDVFRCRAKGIFRREKIKPLAGDDVEIEITHEGDREGNVIRILPRKSVLIRPPVANIDQVLVTFALADPAPGHYLINRFLVMLAQKELPCVLCFNKRDLVSESACDALCAVYRDAGVRICTVSARTGEGLEELKSLLSGKVSAVAGPSGAGKSSLINALLSEERMETGTLSKKLARGKNTTRHSELIALRERGTYLCDTPGFMSLDLKETKPEELARFYPEFCVRADACRFAGCLHLTEPDCEVRAALQRGEIAPERYDAYRLLYEELSGLRPVYEKKAKQGV